MKCNSKNVVKQGLFTFFFFRIKKKREKKIGISLSPIPLTNFISLDPSTKGRETREEKKKETKKGKDGSNGGKTRARSEGKNRAWLFAPFFL